MNEFSKSSTEFEEALRVFYCLMEKAENDREISLKAANDLRKAVERFEETTRTSLAITALERAMKPIARDIGTSVKSDISAMYKEAEKAKECAEAVTTNMTQKARKILWPILGVQAMLIVLILTLITVGYFYFSPLFGLEAKRAEYAQLAQNVEFLELVEKSSVRPCSTKEGQRYLCTKIYRNGSADNQVYYVQPY
jgi:hypothetical protein